MSLPTPVRENHYGKILIPMRGNETDRYDRFSPGFDEILIPMRGNELGSNALTMSTSRDPNPHEG